MTVSDDGGVVELPAGLAPRKSFAKFMIKALFIV